VKTNIAFRFVVGASLLLVLWSGRSQSQENPKNVTISDLAVHPQKYDGRLVRVQAVLVFGWEGDNFLVDPSKPVPLYMPSRADPAAVWFYSKPTNEQRVYAGIHRRVVYGSFKGYFHVVDKPHIVNAVFDPGSLQFEAVDSSVADQQPQSLAAATIEGDVDETRSILRSHVGLRKKYRNTLLFLAANTGRDDFARDLIAAGSNPTFTRAGADTSLMVAAWNCKLDVARTLLSHSASVNAANIKGETALMYASQTCHDGQMVKLLLQAGANPNAKTPDDFTTLMWAAGNPQNSEELLKAGADPTVKDRDGNTAESDNCERGEAGHAQVCNLIREALKNAAQHSTK
jgi:ankyrin repeat protein